MEDYDEQQILEKARYVREALDILDDVRDSTSFADYCEDRPTRDVVERELQTAIEACIDIGQMYLAGHGASVPDENAAVFRELQARGILDDETARQMADAAGFRNVLAHRYGADIDDETVFDVLHDGLDVYTRYLAEIRDDLDD